MVPYEFQYNDCKYEMIYKINSMTIQSPHLVFNIDEEDFVNYWNNWMRAGVFAELQELTPLYHMLCSMDYMEPVLFTANNRQSPGYQLLLGRNRAFEQMRRS